jgi:alpha-tubulin suppressor-like RCC1 family protein
VVAVAAGGFRSLVLKQDGSVIAWGNNVYGQNTVPAGLRGVIAIATPAAGDAEAGGHNLALKADGTVVALGLNNSGQCAVPSGLSNVISIAAGEYHRLALLR